MNKTGSSPQNPVNTVWSFSNSAVHKTHMRGLIPILWVSVLEINLKSGAGPKNLHF